MISNCAMRSRGNAIPIRFPVVSLQKIAMGVLLFVAMPLPSFAQRIEFRNVVPDAFIQDVLIQDGEQLDGQPNPANTKPLLVKQMRGLIQNELSIIGDLCELTPAQQQSLADLAESEWKAKTNASIIKRTQENVYGMVDLDGLAERLVRNWLESIANPDQVAKYDDELADRMRWRQKAVVSKLLDTLESKLNLSGVQMEQIEAVLNEKWKDRFYRSLEATFDNASLLPEIRPTWISGLLSEAQRAALVTREGQQQRFGVQQGWQDSPSLAVTERFKVGSAISMEPKEAEPKDKKPSPVDAILEKAKAEDERTNDVKKP